MTLNQQLRLKEQKKTPQLTSLLLMWSRIYANLSKQLVDNMFGEGCDSSTTTCPTSGTSEIEGATIYWVKDTTTEIITLTITDENGNVTEMSVPIGDFVF